MVAMCSVLRRITAPHADLFPFVLNAPVLSLTHNAQPLPGGFLDEVFGAMSMAAFHLACHCDRRTQLVFHLRHWFKMTPVHTPSVSARMIQLFSGRNISNEYLVGNNMCMARSFIDTDRSVSIFVVAKRPEPTRTFWNHQGPEHESVYQLHASGFPRFLPSVQIRNV